MTDTQTAVNGQTKKRNRIVNSDNDSGQQANTTSVDKDVNPRRKKKSKIWNRMFV